MDGEWEPPVIQNPEYKVSTARGASGGWRRGRAPLLNPVLCPPG